LKVRSSRLQHSEHCQKRKSWLYQTLSFPSQTFAVGYLKNATGNLEGNNP
jgi:hypothetical protein